MRFMDKLFPPKITAFLCLYTHLISKQKIISFGWIHHDLWIFTTRTPAQFPLR